MKLYRSRDRGTAHRWLVQVVYLLLLNLLIAMMGDTYAKIAAIKNEWMRQWARVVLIVERTVPPRERLRMQDLYCDKNSDGEKVDIDNYNLCPSLYLFPGFGHETVSQ